MRIEAAPGSSRAQGAKPPLASNSPCPRMPGDAQRDAGDRCGGPRPQRQRHPLAGRILAIIGGALAARPPGMFEDQDDGALGYFGDSKAAENVKP